MKQRPKQALMHMGLLREKTPTLALNKLLANVRI